jgi:hypothetical protein
MHEEVQDLYSLPNIIRRLKIKEHEMGRTCGMHGEGRKKRDSHEILVGKPMEKRLFGTLKIQTKREGNIIMQCKATGRDGNEWIHVVPNRDKSWVLVNMSKNLQSP